MNLKRVYITGCDCTGKSTMAESISKATGEGIAKFSFEPDQKKREEEMHLYKRIATTSDMPILMDRGWHGRFCYHNVLGKQEHNEEEIMDLSHCFTASGGTILFMTASYGTILHRLRKRGDDFINSNDIAGILKRYDELQSMLEERGIPFYIIDTSNL